VSEPQHVPVLSERVVGLLAPALLAPGSVVVDATLGLGGHASALLAAAPQAHLVGLDRDPEALQRSASNLAGYDGRTTLVHAVFDRLPEVLADLGITEVAGVLLDLGVSSMQLDEDERGFAYSRDAPLDMRMDPTRGATAADVLNSYDARALARVLRELGEERFADRIARAVVQARGDAPFTSSRRLVELLYAAVPAATRRTGGHPAKRTFQALRIEVNDELGALRRVLPAALDALAVGGRLVVLSYQSLEDRIVKSALAPGLVSTAPPDLPLPPPETDPWLRRLAWGSSADDGEVAANPRSASVRLRAVEKTAPRRAA